jgi:hypothetical protein
VGILAYFRDEEEFVTLFVTIGRRPMVIVDRISEQLSVISEQKLNTENGEINNDK